MNKIFPEGFYWGAATASYQVEGGIENCDWAEAARERHVPQCGRACDHYSRYEADFDLVKELSNNAHRFSVEWARIEPEEGKFDYEAIAHYRRVLEALKERNITPFVTLWHFTLPLWFSKAGGFERKDSPEVFARYSAFAVKELGDLCSHFSTMNEPNVLATHGYLYGVWSPFKQAKIGPRILGQGSLSKPSFANIFTYLKVESNLIDAHNTAYNTIKKVRPEVKISLVKQVHVYGSKDGAINWIKYKLSTYFQNHRFLSRTHKSLDEIGLNYYHCDIFGEPWTGKRTDMHWNFRPERIYDAIMLLQRWNKPVFVSEAGLADEDDSDRAEYITKQVEATWRAIQNGANVIGHMYWSLLDNYEWAEGFEKRFGLIAVNYETLERAVRPSAYVYKKICEDNGIVE